MMPEIKHAVNFIKQNYRHKPAVSIVLGSGLGSLTDEINLSLSGKHREWHKGKLVFGETGGKKVVAMAGGFHFYKGYTTEQVVFPIRVMQFLISQLITNPPIVKKLQRTEYPFPGYE
jgi:purine-nucleoside phosphorylase